MGLGVMADIDELTKATTLNSVGFNELGARRQESPDFNLEMVRAQPNFVLRVKHNNNSFQLILRVDLATNVGPVSAECYGNFLVSSSAPILTQDLLTEYANEVGIMIILPYLRQGIADITQRVFGNPITAPIYERGQLKFEPRMSS